ncbi:MAG: hypothetical protein IT563_08540 [Alphaproteobacteria bacterium]|nr:hypothetical protein [Alphaproteobacteria bacterium]
MAKISNNERKVCDAVARVLEARSGQPRTNASRPEACGAIPPIDYEFRLGNLVYSIEHTNIEAFEGQIRSGVDFSMLVEPIIAALNGNMPKPGKYYLTFPIDTRANVLPGELASIQDSIVAWVKEQAVMLHAEAPMRLDRTASPRGYRGVRKATPVGSPFEITLTRELHWATPAAADGKLVVARWAPQDIEGLRRIRLCRAFDKKLPYLTKCKEAGSYSVLILETNDIALTNHGLVADAIEAAISRYTQHPDEIFLVDTTIETEWTVWSIRRGGVLFPDENQPRRFFEFAPRQLRDV